MDTARGIECHHSLMHTSGVPTAMPCMDTSLANQTKRTLAAPAGAGRAFPWLRPAFEGEPPLSVRVHAPGHEAVAQDEPVGFARIGARSAGWRCRERRGPRT